MLVVLHTVSSYNTLLANLLQYVFSRLKRRKAKNKKNVLKCKEQEASRFKLQMKNSIATKDVVDSPLQQINSSD